MTRRVANEPLHASIVASLYKNRDTPIQTGSHSSGACVRLDYRRDVIEEARRGAKELSDSKVAARKTTREARVVRLGGDGVNPA